MVNLKLANCVGQPLQITFLGGPGAQYFDEATGQFEPYLEGKALRVRVPVFAKNVAASAYTEAAARLMDAEAGGETKRLDKDLIQAANARVAVLMKDQLPGIYRQTTPGATPPPVGTTPAESFDITRIVKPINAQTLSQAGSYDNTPNGQLGAVLAGLGASGAAAGTVERPASRLNDFLASDLADGRLDLQGIVPARGARPVPLITLQPGAGGITTVRDPIPYTYESFWRSKSSSAGAVATVAGDPALQGATRATAIANYVSTLRSIYRVSISNPPPNEASVFNTVSDGTQAVKLYADGRLTLRRTMAAGFSASQYLDTNKFDTPAEVTVPSPDDKGFADVKVGPRADVIALTKDRSRLVYIPPYALYRVQGNEFPLNETARRRPRTRRHAAR
jgi:hypothetical protein